MLRDLVTLADIAAVLLQSFDLQQQILLLRAFLSEPFRKCLRPQLKAENADAALGF